jgi:HAD superfamily hydrolase (TIGR01490 family)
MLRKEVKEVGEVKDVQNRNAEVAAFFDLDGTLLPLPSLETRFFRRLRYLRMIGLTNYLGWLREAVRLLPRGIKQILYANKMYLRRVRADAADAGQDSAPRHGGEGPSPGEFFPEALERVAWHAQHGHAIVIVSGTLEPLAKRAAIELEEELTRRGSGTAIEVCATQLETVDGVWTGRIVGDAMFGEAKLRAVKRTAARRGFDLEKCFGYGDSVHDRCMLESMGRPTAVNPSNDLARIAKRNGWPVLCAPKRGSQRRERRPRREHRAQERLGSNLCPRVRGQDIGNE